MKKDKNTKKFLPMIIILLIVSSISLVGVAFAADNNVIIGYKQKPSNEDKANITSHGGKIKQSFNIVSAISANLSDQAIADIKKDPDVVYIENDTVMKATDEYSNSWGVSHINSKIVHDNNITGTGVKVAIFDTGIDYNHEDLKDNYKGGINIIYGNNDPFDDSYDSHGTHIAGIIAAEKNGIGVVGVAPNADLYAVKVLDGGGYGAASFVISGIEWAITNKMDIVSMSLGSVENSTTLNMAIDNAYYNASILLVASAGNTGTVLYPAKYDSVIAVTATDQSDLKASFSPIDPKIELSAPGVNIVSTTGSANSNVSCRSSYCPLSGTSMAAPHVTGVAALLISSHNLTDVNYDGKINNVDVRLQMQNTAKDLGSPGIDSTFGYGLVDASAVFGVTPTPTPTPIHERKGSISGYIINAATGQGIPKWTITLVGHDLKQQKITDAKGFYKFDDLPADTYIVREIIAKDFKNITPSYISINLKSGQQSQNNNFKNMPKDKKEN